ncbi:ABC-2 type transport system permease protein [Luteococcus japonicus]|uniref:ABC-2 type transport system permease protein n=1 Tax=Luteococcus japonicus TaxID=33984 RepID=A0A3N1ZXS1_9ACTN|nr:ABC transporter permease [Luteococcus japonicus]ROR55649.1 ABC-2 type transport system permease protein [Luteococcus japonicus]
MIVDKPLDTPLDFAPDAAPANRGAMIRNHALTEAKLILRNGEQLMIALLIPLGLLFFGHFADGRYGITENHVAPNVLALAVWSSCFTSLAIATAFERRYGVLERLSATPLGHGGLLAGKAVGITIIATGQFLLLGAVGQLLGWRIEPSALQWPVMLLGVPLAMFVFANLALAMAGLLRAEATLAFANIIYLVGLMAGGIMWPVSSFPTRLQPLIAGTPTGALGEILRHWTSGGVTWTSLLVLIVWAVVAHLIARKAFRWTS